MMAHCYFASRREARIQDKTLGAGIEEINYERDGEHS